MVSKLLFSLQELADELQMDESTIRFWQDQFDAWLPYLGRGREKWYPAIAVDVLRFIKRHVDDGRNEEEIENELKEQYRLLAKNGHKGTESIEDLSQAQQPAPISVQAIQEILEAMNSHQKRMADAQEKRLQIEERKIAALEKQDENNNRLVQTLEEILHVLKNLSESGSVPSAQTTPLAEQIETSHPPQSDESIISSMASIPIDSNSTDNFTDLMEQPFPDDSSEPPNDSELQPLESAGVFPLETDDLVDLIEPLPPPSAPRSETLVESPQEKPAQVMENDDLADLIEPMAPPPPADDQIQTIELAQEGSPALPQVSPSKINRTVVPDDYKSKMIAVIIGMKEKQKLSIADTVQRLNDKGYKTLSGESHWTPAAIEQIYQHIDLVQVSRKRSA